MSRSNTMSRDNWIKSENKNELKSKAENILTNIKDNKSKTKLIQIDSKTWKEVSID